MSFYYQICLLIILHFVMLGAPDVKEQYAQQIKTIKEHFEQKYATCTNEKQCECYQKAVERFNAMLDGVAQILSQLSYEEQQQLAHMAHKMTDSRCNNGSFAFEAWLAQDWELLSKIEQLDWQDKAKTATVKERIKHDIFRSELWFMKTMSAKNSHKEFKKDWIREYAK